MFETIFTGLWVIGSILVGVSQASGGRVGRGITWFLMSMLVSPIFAVVLLDQQNARSAADQIDYIFDDNADALKKPPAPEDNSKDP